MQAPELETLIEAWSTHPCNHEDLTKQYQSQDTTGMYLCMGCGKDYEIRPEEGEVMFHEAGDCKIPIHLN